MIAVVALTLVAALAAPLAGGRQTSAAGPAGARVIPTERRSNIFFARATIDGKGPFWLTVDTGATLTVIDPATAATLGLTVRDQGRQPNVGVGGGLTQMGTTRGVSIEIGSAPPFRPPRLFVVPVRASATVLGHRIDGVLGTDFLRRFVVEFDYRAGRIVMHDPARFAYDGPGVITRILVDGNLLLARATIGLTDGEELSARLLIDTGTSARFSLNAPFVKRHRLLRFKSLGLTASLGIDGVSAAPVIALRSLAFGRAVIERPEAALSRASSGLSASAAFDGIIGAELLSAFRIFIDYPAGRLILER